GQSGAVFSPLHGWSCDTVTEFEVVLANSSTVTVTQLSHPDLFWALRGGGNNFGIIAMPKEVWQIVVTLGWHVRSQNFVISDRMVVSDLPDLPHEPVQPVGEYVIDT